MFNLTTKAVMELLGVSETSFYRIKKASPDFPKPKNYGKRILRYSREEILEWVKNRKETVYAR